MNKLAKLWREMAGLARVLGTRDFLRWCGLFVANLLSVLKRGSLGPVDKAFGMTVRYRCAGRWWEIREGALGVVREIAAGECYVAGSELREARVILDLGGNCGVFTLFALGHAPKATVQAVEVNPETARVLAQNLALNGVDRRAKVANAFAGELTDYVRGLQSNYPALGPFDLAAWLSSVGECDFLKCDIEGAEYGLFGPDSGWLRRVKRMSLEYHGEWEDGAGLAKIIEGHGFMVKQRPHGVLGYLNCERIGDA
jgi:hypothetical protein